MPRWRRGSLAACGTEDGRRPGTSFDRVLPLFNNFHIEVITIQSTRTARILGKISCMTIEIRDVLMRAVNIGNIMNIVQATHHRLSREVVRLHILFLFHDAQVTVDLVDITRDLNEKSTTAGE